MVTRKKASIKKEPTGQALGLSNDQEEEVVIRKSAEISIRSDFIDSAMLQKTYDCKEASAQFLLLVS